jgi:hypothetical protein
MTLVGERRAEAADRGAARPERPAGRLAFALATAAAALLALTVAAPGLLRGETLFWRDHTMYAFPLFARADACARRGAAPGWDETIWCGTPSVGEGIAPDDPRLRALLGAAAALGLGLERSYALFFAAHAVAAALAMALLARTLGASRPAALAGGLAFAFSGALAAGNEYVVILLSGAWLPLVPAGALRAARGAGAAAVAWAALGAGGFALALLGDTQTALLGAGAASLLVLGDAAPLGRRLLALAAVLAGGPALAAPHLAQLAALVPLSERAGAIPYDVAARFSMRPVRLLEWIAPAPFGTLYPSRYDARVLDPGEAFPMIASAYSGASTLALAALAIGRGRARAVLFALFAAAVALALGRHAPLHRLVYALPPFDRFRYPEKYLALASLALAGLAALGADRFLRARPARGLAVVGVVLGIAAAGLALAPPPGRAIAHAAAFLAALALAAGLEGRRRAAALVLVLGLDVAIAARPVFPTARPEIRRDARAAEAILAAERAAPSLAPPRVIRDPRIDFNGGDAVALVDRGLSLDAAPTRFAVDTLWGRTAPLFGIETFDAVTTLPLARFARLSSALAHDPPALARIGELAGCGYVVAARASEIAADPRYEPIGALEPEGVIVLRDRGFRGRAWVVGAARGAAGPEEARRTALAADFDPGAEVALEGDVSPGGAAGSAGRVLAVRPGDDRIGLEVEAAREAWLVVADAYHPAWRAEVGGRPAEIRPANGFARAVRVGPGRSEVVMTYAAPAKPLGRAIAGAAALAFAAAGALAAARGRRRAVSGEA